MLLLPFVNGVGAADLRPTQCPLMMFLVLLSVAGGSLKHLCVQVSLRFRRSGTSSPVKILISLLGVVLFLLITDSCSTPDLMCFRSSLPSDLESLSETRIFV